jgi:hypothetical protein
MQIALDESTVSARPRLSEGEYEKVEAVGLKVVEALNSGDLED